MYKNYFFKTIFLLLFVFLVSSVSAQRTGTIYTKDGSVFEKITFKKNVRLKIISFLYSEKKMYISFADISKILNGEGADISKIVLGVYYDPESKRTQNQNNNIEWLNDINAKPWSVSAFFQMGYTTPAGKYYDGFSSGKSVNADIAVSVAEEYSLRFSYSTGGIELPKNFIIFESNEPSISILDQSLDYDTKRYFVSFQMNRPLAPYKEEQSYFYGYAGFGYLSEKLSLNVSILDTNTNLVYTDQTVLNETYESLRMGMGLVKILTPHIGFNTEISFDIVGAFQEEIEAIWFEFKIGLTLVM